MFLQIALKNPKIGKKNFFISNKKRERQTNSQIGKQTIRKFRQTNKYKEVCKRRGKMKKKWNKNIVFIKLSVVQNKLYG